MAVVTLTATRRHKFPLTDANARAVPKTANLVSVFSTVEVGSDDSANSTYTMARIPSNARIMPGSTVYWDDLASTGSPTLDVGLAGSQITNDPDALNNGLDCTGAGSSGIFADHADGGKFAWELAGETSDPGGMLDIYVSLVDAAVNVGGTVSLELTYVVD